MENRSGVKVAVSLMMILSVIFSVSCKSETEETTDPAGVSGGLFDRSAQIQSQVLDNLVADEVVVETETEPEEIHDATGMLFEDVVTYMNEDQVVKNWFDTTNRITTFDGECWYFDEELQAELNAEVSEDPNIINYTSFRVYSEDITESMSIVTRFDIFELDTESDAYKNAVKTGELTYTYKSQVRDLSNVDWKEFQEKLPDMKTSERMFFTYDEETGELLMNEPELKTIKIDSVNGPFIIVVTSGLITDTGFYEKDNSESQTAQKIIETFNSMSY
ncbi:MAG: hypothetical protein K6G47_07600 [Clostridia bacterium]|nr:hypothetical protein [Clostridia bacterium]